MILWVDPPGGMGVVGMVLLGLVLFCAGMLVRAVWLEMAEQGLR